MLQEYQYESDPDNDLLNEEDVNVELVNSNKSQIINTLKAGEANLLVLSDMEVEETATPSVSLRNDISKIFTGGVRDALKLQKLCDLEKKNLLVKHEMPNKNFSWPYTNRLGQKAYLGIRHCSGSYDCFKYSQDLEGLVCIPCALFAASSAENDRRKQTKLGKLVNMALQKYDHLTGKDGYLRSHMNTEYHKTAVTKADQFLYTLENCDMIINKVDDQRMSQVRENRRRLVPIIKTMLICGRLGIAFRKNTHKNNLQDFNYNLPLVYEDGNFTALLKFRVDAGDMELKQQLETAGRNATYISKTIQNELISICGSIVAESIIQEIQLARYFSIIADETTDTSHQEQLVICLRYVKQQENGVHVIKEEFLEFHAASDLSGAGMASQILRFVKNHGLDIKDCVGQGYDGASSMSGIVNGVQANILREAPCAIYNHCSSHNLNLVLNSASSVPEVRNMMSTVQEVTKFINDSVKRREYTDWSLDKP